MDIARLRILVDMDSAGVVRGAAQSTAAIAGFERGTTSALSRITQSFSGLSFAQKGLVGLGAASVLVGTALGAVVGPALEFESAFAGVEKTVDGTPEQLADIRDGILDLSATIPTAASDLADIAANAGQLGVETPKVLEFTKTVAGLGETTDLSFDSAAQSLARFLNVTGNDVSVERLGDVIVELGNNSATTESQILTFAQRLASAFTVAGASEQEILALAASLSSLGLEAEAGASALNTSITVIADAAKLGGTELKVLADVAGVTTAEFAELARNAPVDALFLFAEGLGEVTKEGRSITPILDQLGLSGLRTTRALQVLALGTDQARESQRLAGEQFRTGGALAEEAGKRYETTAARIEILQNRLTRLAIELGTPALGLFAAGADAAGDAVERLFEAVAPLGPQLVSTFGDAATAVGFFVDVLGSPALALGVAGLESLVEVLSAVLSVLDVLGPVGTAVIGLLVADLLLVGPASSAAVSGLSRMGVSLTAVQANATGASVALNRTSASALAASRALSAIGPLALFAGLAIAAQRAQEQMGRTRAESEALARELSVNLAQAFESGDADDLVIDLQQLEDQIRDLRIEQAQLAADATSETGFLGIFGVETPGLDSFDRKLRQIFGTSTEAERRLSEVGIQIQDLEAVFSEFEVQNFSGKMVVAAQATGLSRDAVFELSQELGIQEQLLSDDADTRNGAILKLIEHTAASVALADASGILLDKILAETVGVEDYAEALGITEAQLMQVANATDGVNFEDLFNPEKAVRAFDVIKALLGAYESLAGQIGITTDEYLAQIQAVDSLAGSHSELRKAVEGAQSALALIEEQQRITNEATEAFGEALDGIGQTGGLEAAASALRTLTLEYAASGVTAAEAADKQRELYDSFLQAAIGAGIAEEEAIAVAVALGLVPEAVLSEITVKGQEAADEADRVENILVGLAREYQAELTAEADVLNSVVEESGLFLNDFIDADYVALLEANGVPLDEAVELARAKAQGFVDTEFVAILEANGLSAEEVIAEAQRAAELYRDTEYMAFLEANGIDAVEVIGFTQEQADALAAGDYTAFLKAVDDGALATIDAVQGRAAGYANPYRAADAGSLGIDLPPGGSGYTASLTAVDKASPVIQGAVRELANFRSKEITLTANYRSTGSGALSTQRSTGGITIPSGGSSRGGGGGGSSTFFERGGISSATNEVNRLNESNSVTSSDLARSLTTALTSSDLTRSNETNRLNLTTFRDGGITRTSNETNRLNLSETDRTSQSDRVSATDLVNLTTFRDGGITRTDRTSETASNRVTEVDRLTETDRTSLSRFRDGGITRTDTASDRSTSTDRVSETDRLSVVDRLSETDRVSLARFRDGGITRTSTDRVSETDRVTDRVTDMSRSDVSRFRDGGITETVANRLTEHLTLVDRLTEANRSDVSRFRDGGVTTTTNETSRLNEANRLSETDRLNLSRFRDGAVTTEVNRLNLTQGETSSASSDTVSSQSIVDRIREVTRYQDGGLSSIEALGSARSQAYEFGALSPVGVQATPGVADIFTPVTPWRYFAEPVTGGETYIPHQGDRTRNRNIWETHGRMAGFMEHGGIATFMQNGGLTGQTVNNFGGGGTSIAISAPINVDLSAVPQGATLAEVGAEINRQVSQAFGDLGRVILNAP